MHKKCEALTWFMRLSVVMRVPITLIYSWLILIEIETVI